MAIELDVLAASLTGPHREGLRLHIHSIYGQDSHFRADSRFLIQFPQLRYFDGYLTLSSPADLDRLARLDYRQLRLDLAHQISNPQLLAPLLPAGTGRLELDNLIGAESLSLVVEAGRAQFCDRGCYRTAGAAATLAWLPLLAAPGITQLADAYLTPELLRRLPAHISQIWLTGPELLAFRGWPHPIQLCWAGSELPTFEIEALDPAVTACWLPQTQLRSELTGLAGLSLTPEAVLALTQRWNFGLEIWVPAGCSSALLEVVRGHLRRLGWSGVSFNFRTT